MKDYLKQIDEVIRKGEFKDNWDSLSNYRIPEWYQKLKFGIFIHWGIFSVPAFNNEWYSRNMYIQGTPEFDHHVKTYENTLITKFFGLHRIKPSSGQKVLMHPSCTISLALRLILTSNISLLHCSSALW